MNKLPEGVEQTDGECTCACHTGKHLYHVVWKPCCDDPVQGGVAMKVFPMPNSEAPENIVIGRTEEEARQTFENMFK